MLKAKLCAITAKNEATYATDATPSAAADAMLATDVDVSPLELETEERELVLPWYGHQGEFVSGQFARAKFKTELAGGGAAGTAPKWGPLAKGCAMSETTNAGVSVVYAPISTGEVGTSIYFYINGRLHKFLGSLGSARIMFDAGKSPKIEWDFMGLYSIPTDSAMITPTLTGWTKPVPVNNVNTTPLTLHAYAIKMKQLSIDLGVQNVYRNLPNSEAVRFIGRKAKYSAMFEDELVATKDWWTIIKAGTLGALAVTHGLTAGNIVAIAAANVQVARPKLSRDNDISMLGVDGGIVPTVAGNDEFSITVS